MILSSECLPFMEANLFPTLGNESGLILLAEKNTDINCFCLFTINVLNFEHYIPYFCLPKVCFFCICFLTISICWVKILAGNILKYFSYFSQEIGFDISCKLSLREITCMECQTTFSWKNKKKHHQFVVC